MDERLFRTTFHFPDENPNQVLHLNHSIFLGVKYSFFYTTINSIIDKLALSELHPLLKDLVAIRIFEPASKLRSNEFMEHFFGIVHHRKTYYKLALLVGLNSNKR